MTNEDEKRKVLAQIGSILATIQCEPPELQAYFAPLYRDLARHRADILRSLNQNQTTYQRQPQPYLQRPPNRISFGDFEPENDRLRA